MKKALVILLFAAFGLAAQAPTGAGLTMQTVAKKAKAAEPPVITIPKDAVANPDGTYAWTDKDGTKWTYLNTPFGVMKTRNSNAPVATTLPNNVKVFDEGDKVRFEVPTPFGPMHTEKNKSDLTDDERRIVESRTAASAEKRN